MADDATVEVAAIAQRFIAWKKWRSSRMFLGGEMRLKSSKEAIASYNSECHMKRTIVPSDGMQIKNNFEIGFSKGYCRYLHKIGKTLRVQKSA